MLFALDLHNVFPRQVEFKWWLLFFTLSLMSLEAATFYLSVPSVMVSGPYDP